MTGANLEGVKLEDAILEAVALDESLDDDKLLAVAS